MTSLTPFLDDRQKFDMAVRGYLWRQAANASEFFGRKVASALKRIVDADEHEVPTELLECPAWSEFADLFEYAVAGVEPAGGAPVARDFYDVFLGPNGVSDMEEQIQQVYFLAVARHVLDGGDREFSMFEDVPSGYLSVLEIAVLARMEPRSVRNAMHPKLPDRLVGEQHGNRTFISVPEARRWLAGRRSFVQTTKPGSEVKERLSAVSLSQELVAQLVLTAAKEGISVEKLVSRCLNASARQE